MREAVWGGGELVKRILRFIVNGFTAVLVALSIAIALLWIFTLSQPQQFYREHMEIAFPNNDKTMEETNDYFEFDAGEFYWASRHTGPAPIFDGPDYSRCHIAWTTRQRWEGECESTGFDLSLYFAERGHGLGFTTLEKGGPYFQIAMMPIWVLPAVTVPFPAIRFLLLIARSMARRRKKRGDCIGRGTTVRPEVTA